MSYSKYSLKPNKLIYSSWEHQTKCVTYTEVLWSVRERSKQKAFFCTEVFSELRKQKCGDFVFGQCSPCMSVQHNNRLSNHREEQ